MQTRCNRSLLQFGAVAALILVLAGCTKGGQFDPTTLLDNDMFDSKKPVAGQREPVFPNGVPGATSGIPADLYKGYQPPPEQTVDTGAAPTPVAPDAEAQPEEKPKPKPKPKPKVARAPANSGTKISVGLKPSTPATQREPRPSQAATQPQPSQSVWPAPPSTSQAQPSQSVWPAPPPTGGAPQQTAQPSQSIWPNPPAPGTSSQ